MIHNDDNSVAVVTTGTCDNDAGAVSDVMMTIHDDVVMMAANDAVMTTMMLHAPSRIDYRAHPAQLPSTLRFYGDTLYQT